MNIYKLTQNVNNGYDTYDSCIVVAASVEEAIRIHPSGKQEEWNMYYNAWLSSPEDVTCILVGEAAPNIAPGVLLASFNAG